MRGTNIQAVEPCKSFRFCPRCGIEALLHFDARAIHCTKCGFELFLNSAAASAVLITFEGRLLVTVRGREPFKGSFDLPGGFIEFDESAEDAARREVMEELNLMLTDLTYLTSAPNDYLYAGIMYKTTDLFFLASIDNLDALLPNDDVSGYELVNPDRFDLNRLAFASTRRAFSAFINHRARLKE